MMMVAIALGAVAVGFGVGILSGLLGVGGGTVMIPLLRLAFGLPALETTATSLFFACPTSISGSIGHIRRNTSIWKLGLAMGIAGACLAPLGSLFSKTAGPVVTMVCAAIVIVYTAVRMLRQGIKMPGRKARLAAEASGAPVAAEPQLDTSALPGEGPLARRLVLPIIGGAIAGFMSGFLGLGGGFLMIPLLVWAFKLPMRYAAGTSSVAMAILCIPGVVTHGLMGDVHWLLGLALVIGSVPGAQVGSNLASKAPDKLLRIIFGCLLIFGGIMIALNEFGVFG